MSSDFLAGGGVFRGASAAPMGTGLARVLGSQGGSLPGVADAPGIVQPVGLIYDTSDQLSRALQPRRWTSGNFHTIAAPNVVEWWFRAPASASVVITYLRVRGPAGAELTGRIGIGRGIGTPVFLASTLQSGIPIGGSVPGESPVSGPASVPPVGSGPFVTIGPNLGFGSIFVPPWFFDGATFIFIPPGQTFAFETATAGEDVGWSIHWREIPE